MENTPITPYQRNRRAGRMSAPPAPEAETTPAQAPAAEAPRVQAAQTAAPRQASVPLRPGSSAGMAPAAQPVKRPAPKTISGGPGWNMPTAPQQQRPMSRDSYYGDARYPASAAPVRSPGHQGTQRPAGSRPQQQYPRQSAPVYDNRPEAEAPAVPTWLLGTLAIFLIGVMVLFTWSVWMQKELRENADARAKAYQNILYEYHLTETDGGLRVTYQDLIEKYAREYNLQPAFVTAIIRCESSFSTRAESSVGARGLMQMMPDTAEWVGRKLKDDFDYERLWEADTNIRYGCWYLNYLSELFRGDPVMIAAAYHAGQGEVWSWLGNPDISPDGVTVPIENIPISNTKTYAGRVTKAYATYQALLYPQDAAENALPAADGSTVGGSLSHQR